MHYATLFLIVLKVISLKSELIDFTRKNGLLGLAQQSSMTEQNQKGQPTINFHPQSEKHNLFNENYNNNRQATWQSSSDNDNIFFHPIDSSLVGKVNNALEDSEDYEPNDLATFPDDQIKPITQLDEAQSLMFSNYLMKLLLRPGDYEPPLILIKEPPDNTFASANNRGLQLPALDFNGFDVPSKRARYYRRYPWKREHPRNMNYRSQVYQSYDPYNPCNPSKKDVVQLLLALHDARQGKKTQFVNFCNRKRPANSVYTNIRFLGK